MPTVNMHAMHTCTSKCVYEVGGVTVHDWLKKELHRITVIHSVMSEKQHGTSKELSTGSV